MSYSLVRNGTLIDGTGKAPLPDAAVLIKDNRIESVGRAGRIGIPDTSVTEIVAGTTIAAFFAVYVGSRRKAFN